MTGTQTISVVRKAHAALQGIHRSYMMFTSNMSCLRIVINPDTRRKITEEFWLEEAERGSGVHQGFYVESVSFTDVDKPVQFENRMLGLLVDVDKKVPEGEVEIRAVLNKSWEPVL